MKRPLSVTLLALAVLLFAIYQLVWRVIGTLRQLALMRLYGLDAQAAILISIGAVWTIGFALASIGLWQLREWGRRWTMIAVPAYQLHIWIEQLTLERATNAQVPRPADAVFSIVLVLSIWAFLSLPKVRLAFQSSR
jgi:hypothetical protein